MAFFRQWRDKVGPDYPLALDCYMALTKPYAIKLGRALEPYGLKWLEEFLPPDDYEGYKDVKTAALPGVLLFGRGARVHALRVSTASSSQDRSVDILQPDVTWCGGLTEARRVVAMATPTTSSSSRTALLCTLTTSSTLSRTVRWPSSSTCRRAATPSCPTSGGCSQTEPPFRRTAASTFAGPAGPWP